MEVSRIGKANRYSEGSVYEGMVFLAGQVASDANADILGQTQQVLASIDSLLLQAGSNKDKILMAQIFLSDMAYFADMNEVWDSWVSRTSPPSRATVESKLGKPEWKIEIVVVAAK
jgi:enamine deaminase RidA (YjgF/YER057c/UK114 family)